MDRITSWADWEKAKAAEPETEAETAPIAACRAGRHCDLGETRPSAPTDATRIRAPLLAYLIRGGCTACRTTERGVVASGAWVAGQLDLTGARAPGRVILTACTFDAPITAQDCSLPALALEGSKTPGLDLQRSYITGSLFLHDDFHATGEVNLLGASIGGQLSCVDGRFDNAKGDALNAQGAQIRGAVFLRGKLHATGEVSLAGASIGGQLSCINGRFDNAIGDALNAQGAQIARAVLLTDGFNAIGVVRLSGARIGGQLSCVDGRFVNADKDALFAERMTVTESFLFRKDTEVSGRVALSGAHVGDLVDDLACWPKGPDQMILDGFTYERLSGGAPTDSTSRLDWLARGSVWQGEFHPQPYAQLAKVLRAQGQERDAKAIDIARLRLGARYSRKRRWRNATRTKALFAAFENTIDWLGDQLYRRLFGYGYRIERVIVWGLPALFLLASFLSHKAWHEGSMAPNAAPILVSAEWRAVAEDAGIANPAAVWSEDGAAGQDYETFNSLTYGADVVIPILDFGQTDAWAPSTTRGPWGEVLWWARWVLSLLGWIVTGLGAAALTGIIRRD